MEITGLTATAVAIPRKATLTTSYGSRDDATTVLVEISTDVGLTGIGQAVVEAPFYGETAAGIVANVRAHLKAAIIGEDPLDIERLHLRLRRALPGHPNSLACVEMALWDLKGKALGVPVYQLLGGRIQEGVRIIGALTHAPTDSMAREAVELIERFGYQILRMKVGTAPAQDLERYRAVAEAVAGRALLHIDGNAGYGIGEAIPTLTAMERIGSLGAIEQPVANLRDMAEIARRIPVPVVADESLNSPADALEIVRLRAATLGFLKITKVGGLLNAHKIATIYEAAGLRLAVGIYYDVLAAAAAHFAAAVPCVRWPSPFTELTDTILTSPVEPYSNILPAPEAPGLGVELDHDRVRHYRLDL